MPVHLCILLFFFFFLGALCQRSMWHFSNPLFRRRSWCPAAGGVTPCVLNRPYQWSVKVLSKLLAMHGIPEGLQHEKRGNIRPFIDDYFVSWWIFWVEFLSVRDVSWVCYAYMWLYDLRKSKHWISLCSLVQRPNWDQRVNHLEPHQTTLLVRWVWIYLSFEIDQC